MDKNINNKSKEAFSKPRVFIPEPKRSLEETLNYLFDKYGDNKRLVKMKIDK